MASKKRTAALTYKIKGRISGDPAELAAALEEIRAAEGSLTPEHVLAAAEDEEHVLHRHFEWDDEKASREYRLMQARTLIRCIVVSHPGSAPRRVYCHVTEEASGKGRYERMETVAVQHDLYEIVRGRLNLRLVAIQQELGELERLSRGNPGRRASHEKISVAIETARTLNSLVSQL